MFATPVVRSLKSTYSNAAFDMLVFEGTEGIVSANSDLRQVLTVPQRPRLTEHLSLYKRIWRRYDLAVSVQASDRSTLYAWASGLRSIGILVQDRKSWWKRRLLDDWVPLDNLRTHTVSMNTRLLNLLGVTPLATPVIGWSKTDEEVIQSIVPPDGEQGTYVVLHVSPKFSYKQWTVSGWVELAQWLAAQGLRIVVTAGDSEQDHAYAAKLFRSLPSKSVNLAGKISLPALGCLLSQAILYVGTDTAVTHMAAALGVPTVALFGPSNPIKWGPWPKDWSASSTSPWEFRGSQRRGNVFLLQGEGDCVPCLHEGCDRHVNSLSDCLQGLPASRVIEAAGSMLAERRELDRSAGMLISRPSSLRV
ncbi:glycosyltransferase family 9 protein [Petrachloros mirabilis]